MLNTTLTIKSEAIYVTLDEWNANASALKRRLAKGATVEYIAHVPGGMVKARYNGNVIVLHPSSTEELS